MGSPGSSQEAGHAEMMEMVAPEEGKIRRLGRGQRMSTGTAEAQSEPRLPKKTKANTGSSLVSEEAQGGSLLGVNGSHEQMSKRKQNPSAPALSPSYTGNEDADTGWREQQLL